jgi:hypothetical protein
MLLVIKDWAVVSAMMPLPLLTYMFSCYFCFILYYWSFMFSFILLQPIPYGTLPGLTSVASGKAVELFARMLHHPDE